MTYAALVISLVILALILPMLTTLVVELFAPWPEPREHHEFICPQCPCSYESAASLSRHVTHQHGDQAVFRIPRDGGPVR